MGFNSRDRTFEARALARMREVRALDAQGLALHLAICGSREFNDRCFVARVLDRLHAERGIASIRYCTSVRATAFADRWAQLRHCPVAYVPRARLFTAPMHGLVAFDGPREWVEKAARVGVTAWHLVARAYE